MGSGVSLVKPEITLVRFLWMVGSAYFKLFIKFKSFTHSLIHSKLFAAFSVAGAAPGWAALWSQHAYRGAHLGGGGQTENKPPAAAKCQENRAR